MGTMLTVQVVIDTVGQGRNEFRGIAFNNGEHMAGLKSL